MVDEKWYRVIKNLGPFLRIIWKNGKISELISFIVWEIQRTFRMLTYITFTDTAPLTPDHGWTGMAAALAGRLACDVCQVECVRVAYVDRAGNRYACLAAAPTELRCSLADGSSTAFAFESEILSIFVSSKGTILVSLSGGHVLRSLDRGVSFSPSLQLSHGKSRIWFDHGITETNRNELIAGEYGTVVDPESGFRCVAFLYCSTDDGASWETCDFLRKAGVNKHVHMVRYCRTLDAVIVTDGDNKKQLWICRPTNDLPGLKHMRWHLANRLHIQTGGYTALVEYYDKLLFGTDYMGGTNFIITSRDGKLAKSALPDPYRRCPVLGMALRSGGQGTEIWAVMHDSCFEKTRSLVMLSRDGGNSWIKVIEYDGSRCKIEIASASSAELNELLISAYDHAGGVATFVIRDQILQDDPIRGRDS